LGQHCSSRRRLRLCDVNKHLLAQIYAYLVRHCDATSRILLRERYQTIQSLARCDLEILMKACIVNRRESETAIRQSQPRGVDSDITSNYAWKTSVTGLFAYLVRWVKPFSCDGGDIILQRPSFGHRSVHRTSKRGGPATISREYGQQNENLST